MTKKYLLVFSSDNKYSPAAQRLEDQAVDTGWFDEIIVFDSTEKLQSYKPTCFMNGFSERNPRGAGLWAWKPDFILHCMDSYIEKDAIVVYLDAGVELNKHGIVKFETYCSAASNGRIVATRTKKIEFIYSNTKLIKMMGLDVFDILSYQYQAGLLIFSNSNKNRVLIQKWKNICLESDGLFLTAESPLHGFIGENRHDQAIFSALLKMSGCEFSIGNSLAGSPQILSKSRYMKTFPFFSVRNFTERSKIYDDDQVVANNSVIARVEYHFLRIYLKLKSLRHHRES